MQDTTKRMHVLQFQCHRTYIKRRQVNVVGVSDRVSAWRRPGIPAASQAQASRHDPDVPDHWHLSVHRADRTTGVWRGR